jgi:hypothetical protein
VDEKRGAIRRGLQSIDGVGSVSAARLQALQPFRDLDDLVERAATQTVSGHKEYDGTPQSLTGVLGKLYASGALAVLTNVRRIRDAQM